MAVSQRQPDENGASSNSGAELELPPATPSPAQRNPATARGPQLGAARDRALHLVLARAGALEARRERPSTVKAVSGESSSRAGAVAQKRGALLEELRRCPVLGHAAMVAGVSGSTVRRWRAEDAEFDAAVLEALELGVDRLEAETHAQALEVATKGNPTHLLKMFLLKSRRREVYGERLEVSTTHRHEIVVDLVPASQLPAGQPVTIIDGALELEPGPSTRPLPSGELELEHRPGQAARPGNYPPPDGGRFLPDQAEHQAEELEP